MKTIVLPENYEDKLDNCLNGKESEADDQDSFDLDGLYDGLEMLRRSKDSKSEFLFDGLLESGVITLLCGLPYSGKSLVGASASRETALFKTILWSRLQVETRSSLVRQC